MPHPVFVTRMIPQSGLDILTKELGAFDINAQDKSLSRAELLAAVKGRTGLVCMLVDTIDAELLDAAGPQLKVVANVAVGYNNIDVAAATARKIVVSNTPGVLTDTTADIAFGLILASARKFGECERFVRAGKWSDWTFLNFLGQDVTGATLGIVGGGRIGAATAKRGKGFDMPVLYTARHPKPEMDELGAKHVDLDTLLKQSDFVSVHVPLTSETKHHIGARELSLMKPTAHLINTARGPVVDEAALVEALKAKKIAGAGLDVFENEPKLHPGLLELENVTLLPHVGSATIGTRGKMGEMAVRNCIAVLKGQKAPNALN